MSESAVLGMGSVGQSVGAALATGQNWSTTHPYYDVLAGAVDQRVAELTARRGESKASGKAVPVTVALNVDEMASASSYFPEFTLLNYGSGRPGHSWWVQFSRLANEWLMLQARKYSDEVAHLGGAPLAYLLSDFKDAQLLFDPANPVAVHERHGSALDSYRLYQNYVALERDLGRPVDRARYEAYLRKEVFASRSPLAGLKDAGALCVDGSMYAYSPMQVASMMLEAKASLAFGFFVYHPSMMLADDGEIPGTGVFYRKTPGALVLQYPEGVAGVTRYPVDVWDAWLASHSFPVGVGKGKVWFQLELLKNRAHLMFYRLTKLEVEPSDVRVSHALEVEGASSMYVVRSAMLKELGRNPRDESSWNDAWFLVGRRLVDRVYQFAMQLPKESFTRYAVRKQIHVVNDRVTLEGTSVKVNSPLGIRMVDAVAVAVYARAFVDRYEAGQLTKEMMQVVVELAGFSTTSHWRRMWMITKVCALTVWDYTFGYVNEVIREAADWVRDAVSGAAGKGAASFSEAPPYVLLSSAVTSWFRIAEPETLARWAVVKSYASSVNVSGFGARWTRAFCRLGPGFDVTQPVPLSYFRFRVENVSMFSDGAEPTVNAKKFLSHVRAVNSMDEARADRYSIDVQSVVRQVKDGRRVDFNPDADPVYTLNEFYLRVCPGVGIQNLEYDTASISLDPQDRVLAAPYLRLPTYFGDAPRPRKLYRSRLKALNVPRRQGTLQELLSSMAARNLNAPQVSLPQDEDELVRHVWDVFLDEACVPEARKLLAKYQHDPVALGDKALMEWAAQATPEKLDMARREMEEKSEALGEMPVGEYLAMLKSDVKPTLSTKPIETRTEPQVIVYHEKALSALYSSIFRVLVRRFLSLLKPNYHVNLLKDTRDIEGFLNGIHPFGAIVKFLENDFSKYDKSQGRFVFLLEHYVFEQLGMNLEMLSRWLDGHVECTIRSVALGLSLHVMYQRKSGDATTSFGNVLLNVLSVTFAYRGTKVIWALFMGDDSLVCASEIGSEEVAVQTLAEVFNLGAKMYKTDAPYYASNFVLIDNVNEVVALVPDPVKRVERWSMAISADGPQWHERYVSAVDSMSSYLSCFNTVGLARNVAIRYNVSIADCLGVADAIATLLNDEAKFRGIWEEEPEVSNY